MIRYEYGKKVWFQPDFFTDAFLVFTLINKLKIIILYKIYTGIRYNSSEKVRSVDSGGHAYYFSDLAPVVVNTTAAVVLVAL